MALVTNNSYLEQIAFDGVRKELEGDYDQIYLCDLGGNVRKSPKLSGTTHNVFGIQIGVCVGIFVRKRKPKSRFPNIGYAALPEGIRREQRLQILDSAGSFSGLELTPLIPDKRHNWLTFDLRNEFADFLPIADKELKGQASAQVVFNSFSLGINTARDAWTYNFQETALRSSASKMIRNYNEQVSSYSHVSSQLSVDEFVTTDSERISWSEGLKKRLERGLFAAYNASNIRLSLYRPFAAQFLYFSEELNERRYQLPRIFPKSDSENKCIWAKTGSEVPFFCLCADLIPNLLPQGGSQCFPFYTYSEDGTNRRENITDWALEQFRAHYKDKSITKWDIFYYTYAVLHHPEYRTRYAANLKRELPRIPYAPDFHAFAKAGKRLAELHVGYEKQKEFPLERVEKPGQKLDFRVEKMRLSKDKQTLVYNDFLTLTGIPKETFEYRLGNRSALEWVIDQYQVSTDKRSGITNDPNREDDPEYILRLIGQVITVSLETVKIVNGLPDLGLPVQPPSPVASGT